MTTLLVEVEVEGAELSKALLTQFEELTQSVARSHDLQGPVSLVLIDDELMRELNGQFRSKDRTTDVLSFDLGPLPAPQGADEMVCKEIYISVEQARRQASDLGVSQSEELARLFVHGLLHLSGWDHETDEKLHAMEKETDAILARVGLLPQ